MKKLFILLLLLVAITSCNKDEIKPAASAIPEKSSVDSCGCEQQVYRGYALESTNPVFTTVDTTYWKFPMKDTNTLCKGNYFSDTLRISYRQIP